MVAMATVRRVRPSPGFEERAPVVQHISNSGTEDLDDSGIRDMGRATYVTKFKGKLADVGTETASEVRHG